jgi:hypothetical protein
MRSLAGSALVLALSVGLTEHASAAEPDEIGAAEGGQTPSQPVSTILSATRWRRPPRKTICRPISSRG